MIKFVDMELDDEEKQDFAVACGPKPLVPEYPWGLRITLTEKELDRLGLDPEGAAVGGYMHGHFMACITSVTSEKYEGGDRHRIELQIEKLAVESPTEDEENAEAEKAAPPMRKRLRLAYKGT